MVCKAAVTELLPLQLSPLVFTVTRYYYAICTSRH